MRISEILALSNKSLENSGVVSSKLDSLILLCHTLFFSKEQVIFNPDFELNQEQENKFLSLVNRRCNREPVSHLIGKREFYGRDFIVSCDVLDPRSDSETLIEEVLKNFSDKKQKIRILEIGCGSGCLTITLLKEFENATAYALDISKKALEISKKNSELHQVQNRIQLLQSDVFSVFRAPEILRCAQNDKEEAQNDKEKTQNNKEEAQSSKKKICHSEPSEESHETNSAPKFDLIISNPPYIPSQEIENLEAEVKNFEPRLALDGGVDGLDFYRKIAIDATNFLAKNGKIILEIGINQEQEIIKIFTLQKFRFLEAKKDLAGIIRVLCFLID